MDRRIGFVLYQSCWNMMRVGRVSVLRWWWGVGSGLEQGLEEWGGVSLCESGFFV